MASFGHLPRVVGGCLGCKVEYEHIEGTACTVATVVREVPQAEDSGPLLWYLRLAHSLEEVVVFSNDPRIHPAGWSTWTTVRLDIPNRALVSPLGWHREFDWRKYLEDTCSSAVDPKLLTHAANADFIDLIVGEHTQTPTIGGKAGAASASMKRILQVCACCRVSFVKISLLAVRTFRIRLENV